MVRKLRGWVVGCHEVIDASVWRTNGRYLPGDELEQLRLESVRDVRRRGKFIVFECGRGLLVSHNAMAGYWDALHDPWTFDYVEGRRKPLDSDVRVTMTLCNSTGGPAVTLRYHDTRLFGSLRFYKGARGERDVPSLVVLGPDPLDGRWTPEYVRVMCSMEKPVKQVLMDQGNVAGLGNIYATEALYRAGIRPDRLAIRLKQDEIAKLHNACRTVITESLAVECRYDEFLHAYRRARCVECGTHIIREQVAKRSSYYCPVCQD